jgi:hypothetical protein
MEANRSREKRIEGTSSSRRYGVETTTFISPLARKEESSSSSQVRGGWAEDPPDQRRDLPLLPGREEVIRIQGSAPVTRCSAPTSPTRT